MPEETIVVGTDGSDEATMAVAWAADEAARRGHALRVVHAVESQAYEFPVYASPTLEEILVRRGEALLVEADKFARDRNPAVAVSTRLIGSEAASALRAAGDAASQIVVGHRGLGGFAGLVLGSVGVRLAAHAPAPVVIVRPGDPQHDDVIVGVDPARESSATLGYAFEAAAVRRARLRVVHAWRLPFGVADYGDALTTGRIQQALEDELSRVCAPLRERYPDVEVSQEVVGEHPVSALRDRSANAALLVIGAHAHTWRAMTRMGSICHGVVHQAACPVAVVHTG